jgi:DNA-binding IclR family transcriptional regulator
MPERTIHVKSVAKALRLIDYLAEAKRPLSLQELTQYAGIPKSTLHGLLTPLRESGLIEQGQDGRYRLGIRLFELGSIVSASWNIASIARPHLQNIAIQTGQSVQLSMIDKCGVLILDYADTNSSLRVVTEVGDRLPIHSTALGKAILAFLPEIQAKGCLKTGMFSFTPHTITDMEDMMAALEKIRERGYAIEDGENRIGLRGVAAPIFDISGAPVYALGVIGMFRRTISEDFLVAKTLVCAAAEQISQELGYRPAPAKNDFLIL